MKGGAMDPQNETRYVTPRQLAERLGVTPQNVLYHVRQKHIAAERPGGRDVLIPVAEADRVAAMYRPHAQRIWQARRPEQEAQSA
jgi:excisionase family DNA binding protein